MVIRFTRRRTQSEDTGVAPRRSKKLAMLFLGGVVLVSQLLSPLHASAASVYDDVINPISTLTVDNGEQTTDVSNYIYYLTGDGAFENTLTSGQKADITTAVSINQISVAQTDYSSTNRSVVVCWRTTDTGNPWTFTGDGNPYRLSIVDLSGCASISAYQSDKIIVGSTGQALAEYYQPPSSDGYIYRPYLSTIEVQYPSGYEGALVPETAGPTSQLRPNIVADINNKHISIMSKLSIDIIGDYKIYWFITNATFDEEQPPIPFSLEGYSLPDQYLEFDIPTLNETISIQANFVDMNGDQLTPPVGYEFRPSVITLVPDGSIYSVDTDGMVCDDNDSCSYVDTEWEDEPCDLLNLGGCVANIWHYIQVVLGIEKTHGNPTGSPFVTFSTGTYGFTAVVAAPMSFINSLATPGGCTTIYFQNPIPGGDNMAFTCIRPLLMSLGTVFTIYQTLILGFTAYWVGVRVLGLIMDAKRPHNDRIEVHDL